MGSVGAKVPRASIARTVDRDASATAAHQPTRGGNVDDGGLVSFGFYKELYYRSFDCLHIRTKPTPKA